MTETPLVPGARLRFKHGTRTGTATVTRIEHRVDVTTLTHEPVDELRLNDLARVRISVASPIVALPYRQHQEAGRLVLIDPADHATAAAVMIHRLIDPSVSAHPSVSVDHGSTETLGSLPDRAQASSPSNVGA